MIPSAQTLTHSTFKNRFSWYRKLPAATSMSSTTNLNQTQDKMKIVSQHTVIDIDDDAEEPLKAIAVNSNNSKIISTKSSDRKHNALIDFFLDESISTIPLCMKYFAAHELVVLLCGAIYFCQSDIGVIFLSICPGISIISIFLHFLLTQFKVFTKKQKKRSRLMETNFLSLKHYLIAVCVFILGAASIILIYLTNTYLSTLVPLQLTPESSPSYQIFIGEILKFPRSHSWSQQMTQEEATNTNKSFNFRISFVGSIIAPIIEESFKFLLLSLTFPISFIWSFIIKRKSSSSSSYIDYCAQSLFIMFIAVCGGCGIAIMENLGYLAACQWSVTRHYCLPNKDFDILGAGLARGIFSVPFHCVTACIMADIVCMWMNTNLCSCFGSNGCAQSIKFLLSYPISIVIPLFFHSSFNYWMKGIPFLTGIVTVLGFLFAGSRLTKKYWIINGIKQEEEEGSKKKDDDDDITITTMRGDINQEEIDFNITDVEFLMSNGWSI